MAKKTDEQAPDAPEQINQAGTGSTPTAQAGQTVRTPTPGRIVAVKCFDVKVRPAIVTNVPADQIELVDANLQTVPDLDGTDGPVQARRNLKYDPGLTKNDTWCWPN